MTSAIPISGCDLEAAQLPPANPFSSAFSSSVAQPLPVSFQRTRAMFEIICTIGVSTLVWYVLLAGLYR